MAVWALGGSMPNAPATRPCALQDETDPQVRAEWHALAETEDAA
jgi:hypothetical protein